MEYLIEIEGSKLTVLELQLLSYIAGECEGVWAAEEEENEDIECLRESLDQLVLSGFLERESDIAGWMNRWRVPDSAWEVIDPHVDMINYVVDVIGEA